ncbi:hypothetical protein N8K70_10445 [Microbacterium betulae]|uniref:DUF7882 domain-containing protein n=1 Tax=Microbacterium betulae TaxID=2981139 RepID=A0AA97FGS3_9MICO|nr:hypothetical protein [Microbacterium sp. AB]WOF21804.1 hypothetical protein N8K70_10445 [Microbacterium sp. AB]
MGVLYYGASSEPVHLDDRTLAHLKTVIITKLRRQEGFAVTCRPADGDDAGRVVIWIHPAIPLRFEFDEPEPSHLNREWLERLATSANVHGGITLVEEHATS